MKPLLILGFALTVSFLAPLAQAAPDMTPAPVHVAAPAPAVAEDRPVDPTPAAPERHDPYQPSRGDSASGASTVRKHHREDSAPIVTVIQAPDTDDIQNSASVYDGQSDAATDDSCGDATATTAHYSMEDLVNAMQNLDSSY